MTKVVPISATHLSRDLPNKNPALSRIGTEGGNARGQTQNTASAGQLHAAGDPHATPFVAQYLAQQNTPSRSPEERARLQGKACSAYATSRELIFQTLGPISERSL